MSTKDECVWGIHVVTQIMEVCPHTIVQVYLEESSLVKFHDLTLELERHQIAFEVCSKKLLDKKTKDSPHQGIVAYVTPEKALNEGALLDLIESKKNPLIVILDEVQDPHNLGAVLRSACAFKVDAVVSTLKNASPLTSVARKSASGGDLMVPYVQVTNLSRCIQSMQKLGVWIIGTDLNDSAKPIAEHDLKGPIAIVMGSEGKGLRQKTKSYCDYTAFIPMSKSMESLNVSVACGICLYEVYRQRSQ